MILVTCLQICGGHLGFMQAIAWARMVVTYSQERGIVTGIRETFDGEHPCELCRAVQEQRQRQQEPSPAEETSPDFLKFGKLWSSSEPFPWLPDALSEAKPTWNLAPLRTQWCAAPAKPPPLRA